MFQGDITSIEDFRLSGIRLMWFFIVHHMEYLEESKLVCCTYWVNGGARIKYIWLQVVDSLMCKALYLECSDSELFPKFHDWECLTLNECPILAQPYSVKTDFFRLKSCPINEPILLFAFCFRNWNKWLHDGSCSLMHFNCKISLVYYHLGICTKVFCNQAS